MKNEETYISISGDRRARVSTLKSNNTDLNSGSYLVLSNLSKNPKDTWKCSHLEWETKLRKKVLGESIMPRLVDMGAVNIIPGWANAVYKISPKGYEIINILKGCGFPDNYSIENTSRKFFSDKEGMVRECISSTFWETDVVEKRQAVLTEALNAIGESEISRKMERMQYPHLISAELAEDFVPIMDELAKEKIVRCMTVEIDDIIFSKFKVYHNTISGARRRNSSMHNPITRFSIESSSRKSGIP